MEMAKLLMVVMVGRRLEPMIGEIVFPSQRQRLIGAHLESPTEKSSCYYKRSMSRNGIKKRVMGIFDTNNPLISFT